MKPTYIIRFLCLLVFTSLAGAFLAALAGFLIALYGYWFVYGDKGPTLSFQIMMDIIMACIFISPIVWGIWEFFSD